ncbi:unnamed protein product [Calicophoron daubneyi]|uniref:Uncharacterized protein n=1 Tax=Calicophoron daubneyi TaxID=300641 RepID=A0AAV2TLU9_CALDB
MWKPNFPSPSILLEPIALLRCLSSFRYTRPAAFNLLIVPDIHSFLFASGGTMGSNVASFFFEVTGTYDYLAHTSCAFSPDGSSPSEADCDWSIPPTGKQSQIPEKQVGYQRMEASKSAAPNC